MVRGQLRSSGTPLAICLQSCVGIAALLLGRRVLPVIRSSDRRRRGMRLARALGSLPHLRRQFVPTARSRVVRGRLQWNFNTRVEQPAQEVSSVDVKATLADQTPLVFSLML